MPHLTRVDYLAVPWANGRGTTLELVRADGFGGIGWRLSIASVVEDGAFSRFPGVDRGGPGSDRAERAGGPAGGQRVQS